jgi:hypothetical protein
MTIEKNYIASAVASLSNIDSVAREKYKPEELFKDILSGMTFADDFTADAWAMRIAVARVMGNKTTVNLKSFTDDENRDEYQRTFTALWLHITRMHDALATNDEQTATAHRWNAHNEWKELIRRCVPSYKTDEKDIFRFEGRVFGVGAVKGREYKTYTVMTETAFRKYVETLLGCMMDGEVVEYGKKRESASKKATRIENRKQARNMTKTANGENK